ncbi:hypothetical protein [Arenicella xantha]|uniref:Curli production assembly/transport component CsgG n=1 Tax=Arenicella xantha TaxID=644221 RepID=A0A395JJC5_9GAMM|nr:hypothetical protein [Arenicella xantha]RBP50609.1 hypothetical protein DFR28_10220 [Arenicella xantha]
MNLSGKIIVVAGFLLLLAGCTAVPALILEGTRASVQSSQNKFKDIEIVFRQGFDYSSIQSVKSASFLVAEGGNNPFSPGAGTTLADNLAKEFLMKGLNVEEYTMLESLVLENKLGSDTGSLLVAAEMAGVDAIFSGSVEVGQDFNSGFMGIGMGMKQGITGATLKLIDVKSKKIILVVSSNYKKPKSSNDVASDIAEAFYASQSTASDQPKDG